MSRNILIIIILIIVMGISVGAFVFMNMDKEDDSITEIKQELVETDDLITDLETEKKLKLEEEAEDAEEEIVEAEDAEEEVVIEDEAEKPEQIKTLKQIVYGFLGAPYERGPLGEGDNEKLYRTDAFDCTTLVLVTASKFNSNGTSPEEMMKKVNYYPAGTVSYENRLHFSTYRNKVSPFFKDITSDVGGQKTKEKTVILNKERDKEGRLIDIDWQEEIRIKYIVKKDVPGIISYLPLEVGVAFIVDGDEKIGLDVRHEGFVFDREKLVHASSSRGEVFEENFLDFLEKSNYSAVLFFKII